MTEAANLKKCPSDMFHAEPLEDDIYTWHFTLKGVQDSPYEGGLYHGEISLPDDYPMRGPDIIFHTPNGRFTTHKAICLDNTNYHPESWSPLWKVRNILESLDMFFLQDEAGIGAVVKTVTERKDLAQKSLEFVCPHCGPISQHGK